jgi:hypothetical protein
MPMWVPPFWVANRRGGRVPTVAEEDDHATP